MKNLFAAALLLVLTACSCTSGTQTPYNSNPRDPNAAYAQPLMDATVKFEEEITVAPLVDGVVDEAQVFTGYTSGSGVVIDKNVELGTSRILTAWHVCDHMEVGEEISEFFFTLKVLQDRQYVITVDGQQLDFEVLHADRSTDICVVEVYHEFPSYAKLADEMPERGSYVAVVGAPEGNWGWYLASMSDGRYFGLTEIDVAMDEKTTIHYTNYGYYGFAGVGGYSGSGIFYNGKLIGLMTAGSNGFEHAAYGPTLVAIRNALNKAKSI